MRAAKATEHSTRKLDPLKTLCHPGDRRRGGSPILTWTAAPYSHHKIRREHWDIIKGLAARFMARGEQPELILVADRDALALEYWIGAATIAKLAGLTALNDDIAKLGALEIAPRGYAAICELALF